jgi:3-phosphoglycerate kinase
VALLENLRFDPGEEGNSPEFIKNIIDSVGAEVYVQDGFAVVHRAHASTDAVAKFLPVYAGLLVEKEVENLGKVIDKPEKPVLLIIGGAKVDDKEPLIAKFDGIADGQRVGTDTTASANDCCTVMQAAVRGSNNESYCTDIKSFMKECYSEYSNLWNYDSTWTWSGKINGSQKTVQCPKLAWE